MSKRPNIKGRGADIFLGGGSEQPSRLRQKKSAGVAEKAHAEHKFGSLSRSGSGEPSCALVGVKGAVACYIRNNEMLANQAIELQEQSARWAKNTPFAPLFEAHASIVRKIVEYAAAAARNLWQIHD